VTVPRQTKLESLIRGGLLLIGHGTDDPAGVAETVELCRLVADMLPNVVVELAYLEHSLPTIAEAVERLADRLPGGIDCPVRAVPLMLAAAGHAKRDIPRQIMVAQKQNANIDISVASCLGHHPQIVAVSAMRYQQAINCANTELTTPGEQPPKKQVLLLVHRGSSDLDAVQQGLQLAPVRERLTPDAEIRSCFLARATPSLDDELAYWAEKKTDRVIIQPHLLFSGRLTEKLTRLVDTMKERHPRTEWILARHLGPSCQLALAVIDRSGFDACGLSRQGGSAQYGLPNPSTSEA